MKNSLPNPLDLKAAFDAARSLMCPVETNVLTVSTLDNAALRKLIRGDVLAILIRGFIASEHSGLIAAKLLEASSWDRYQTAGAQGIEINGKALFECGRDRTCESYFARAVETRRAIRALLSPLISPIDQMQAELDSAWDHGAQVLTLNNHKCHIGLQRCFRSGGEALPHTDRARLDFDNPKTARMAFQLGLNCYLSTADGGELELWHLLPTDEMYDAARHQTGPTYAIRSEFLPAPDQVIRPEPGDFILFNAAKIHRVRPVSGRGARVTVSAFAGYFSDDEPLQLFS